MCKCRGSPLWLTLGTNSEKEIRLMEIKNLTLFRNCKNRLIYISAPKKS
jgi:hypothetical protein